MLKVCFKTITSAKNARITKERLQRSKDSKGRITKKKGNEGKMNKGLSKLANI